MWIEQLSAALGSPSSLAEHPRASEFGTLAVEPQGRILNAWYGHQSLMQTPIGQDVTERAQALVAGNRLKIEPHMYVMNLGVDTAPGKSKNLVVKYSEGGQLRTSITKDGDRLSLTGIDAAPGSFKLKHPGFAQVVTAKLQARRFIRSALHASQHLHVRFDGGGSMTKLSACSCGQSLRLQLTLPSELCSRSYTHALSPSPMFLYVCHADDSRSYLTSARVQTIRSRKDLAGLTTIETSRMHSETGALIIIAPYTAHVALSPDLQPGYYELRLYILYWWAVGNVRAGGAGGASRGYPFTPLPFKVRAAGEVQSGAPAC
jgi:hypothetical protein